MVEKLKKFFANNFETKKFLLGFRVTVTFFLIVLILNFVNITLSKYSSVVDTNLSPDLAFFVVDVGTTSQTLQLGKILPSNDPYFYTFTVSNYNSQGRVNVALEYSIEFITTTNLPINIKVYLNTSDYSSDGIVSGDTISANDDAMYFRHLVVENTEVFGFRNNQTNNYILKVEFPEIYKHNSKEYEGVIDLVEIVIDAKQIV